MKSKKKLIILILLILFVFLLIYSRNFIKGRAALSWNKGDGQAEGYKIYYGSAPRKGKCPPGGYEKNTDAGDKNNFVINDLENGKTYYFSVTSYNKEGKESCFSEEMEKTISSPFSDWLESFLGKK